ncbi:unnamed protein product [Adineta ricciae]|uniref:Uncharacterized protein n=1 Tax=Adineta ricciae TaxID=249248 RepID=A0A813U3B5_ADIRI|nr:unnamed protein product [Adineta ricciae]CAF0817785.1 unnamed protein product [Adineta ricciae]
MSQHHDELKSHFELLISTQKEVKEEFNAVESTWETNGEHPCLTDIDRWEQEIISRVQQIAARARITTHEMVTKHLSDIRRRLDQLAFDMEQRQQEGNYLDNDIAGVRNQLEQLSSDIDHAHERVRLDISGTNKINWNLLLYVTSKKKFLEKHLNPSELPVEQANSPQEKIWMNLRRLLKNKYVTINEPHSRQSSFRQSTNAAFEPIALTSYGSSNVQQHVKSKLDSASADNSSSNPFSNDDPFKYMAFTTDYDQFLPQASDA